MWDSHIQHAVHIGLEIHTDHVFKDGSCMEVLIGFLFKVCEEPIFQFLWEIEIIHVCTAEQECSVEDHKRISFPLLACSRMDNGSWESLRVPQVRRILLQKASKL